jgi:hypothetical protein
MLRRDVFLTCIGVALAFILAGIFAPSDRMLLGRICLSIGFVVLVIPFLIILFQIKHSIRIFCDDNEVLQFVKKEITQICEKGGSVFSTYILEDAQTTTDVISQILEKAERPVQYRRLIFIDDPDAELKWLSNFLELGKRKNITVSAHVVSNQGRLVSRFIQRVIPFINVFLAKYESSFYQPLFLITFPKRTSISGDNPYKFAIAIKNEGVTRLAWQYLENLLMSCGNLIREVRSIEQYRMWRRVSLSSPKTMSIIEVLREISETCPDIIHIGIFGSVARRLSGTYVDRSLKGYENDLDLVVVLRETIYREDIKTTLVTSIQNRQPNVHIEWSNESSEFYWIRKQYQIDMQLHNIGDSYYVDHPLLGWAVFKDYYVLYSEAGKSIDEIIRIPTQLLNESERSYICLHDEKFGVLRFISECKVASSSIDPRRVISINTRNYAWVLSGTRPYSFEQSLEIVSKQLNHSMMDILLQISRQSTEETIQKQRNDLSKVISYLQVIATQMEQKING